MKRDAIIGTRVMCVMIAGGITTGCNSARTALPTNATGDTGPTAEHAFLESLTQDHASPAERRAFAARTRAGDRFARDCRTGIASACWWAKSLLDDPSFDARIATHCSKGHALSCRAARLQLGLSPAQLHEGCAAGIVAECVELARTADSIGETRFAWERACAITRTTCRSAAEAFLEGEPRDPIKARDMLELGCSFGRADDCLALGAAYLRDELVEPVRGRGRVVYDYACGTTPKRAGTACAEGIRTPLLRPTIDI